MDISGETFRVLSQEFEYSEDALRRHRTNHLKKDLGAIKAAVDDARAEALDEASQKALDEAKKTAAGSMAARLQNASSYVDMLQQIQRTAADLLDKAMKADDLKVSVGFLRELRKQLKLWAELGPKGPGGKPVETIDFSAMDESAREFRIRELIKKIYGIELPSSDYDDEDGLKLKKTSLSVARAQLAKQR